MLRYRFLTVLFFPVILGHILWLSLKNRSGRYFLQRLGLNYTALPSAGLWFHCASVGEVNTLMPLLKNIHQQRPELKIIITTNTITGGKIVQQQKLDYLYHSYLPFDWQFAVRRFIHTVKPASLQVMETEIWPNLFSLCKRAGISINIINARLSSKTTTAKPWVKAILKNSLQNVNAIYARTDNDAQAYVHLGADKSRVSTIGNLKLSTALSHGNDSNFSTDKEYVLLASTHKNEEQEIVKLWQSLDRDELLIIAPRHPERMPAIIRQIDCDDIAIRSRDEAITTSTKIYILDTVGELKNYFANARLVIMGGSFKAIGGHNILEPASYNSAIITGPHMENFSEELQLMLDSDAIVQVASYSELQHALSRLLDDEGQRSRLQQNTARLTHDVEVILQGYTRAVLQ